MQRAVVEELKRRQAEWERQQLHLEQQIESLKRKEQAAVRMQEELQTQLDESAHDG